MTSTSHAPSVNAGQDGESASVTSDNEDAGHDHRFSSDKSASQFLNKKLAIEWAAVNEPISYPHACSLASETLPQFLTSDAKLLLR